MGQMITEQQALEYVAEIERRFKDKLIEEAEGRKNDVKRGAETPRLAALMLQKYAKGLTDAVSLFADSVRAADNIYKLADLLIAEIDPDWREHDKQRWNARPADLSLDEG